MNIHSRARMLTMATVVMFASGAVAALSAASCAKESATGPGDGMAGPATSGAGGAGSGGGAPSSSIAFMQTVGPAGGASSTSTGFVLPADFVGTEFGGYALGEAITATTNDADAGVNVQNDAGANCSLIVGVVRDFQFASVNPGGHPDFQAFLGKGVTPNLVDTIIGRDRKPLYASQCEATVLGGMTGCPSGQMTTTQANFDEWYRSTSGINLPFLIYFKFVQNGNVVTFQSKNYYPLDGAGYGNSGRGDDGNQHNFSFTTEIHTTFRYGGGEQFTFTGDDDVWVYMNDQRGIDLGGVHGAQSGTIDLDQQADTLKLKKGNEYTLDIFQAERHTTASTFRIDTNLQFTNCGTVVPDPPH